MINTILDIQQASLNEKIVYSCEYIGLPPPSISIYDVTGALIYGPEGPNYIRFNRCFFNVDLTALNGFAVKTYYRVNVESDDTPEFEDNYLLYINNDYSLDMIRRIAGLAGVNRRLHTFTYLRGNVYTYKISIYLTAVALNNAVNGFADEPIARYAVTCYYDTKYNRYETRVVKEL